MWIEQPDCLPTSRSPEGLEYVGSLRPHVEGEEAVVFRHDSTERHQLLEIAVGLGSVYQARGESEGALM